MWIHTRYTIPKRAYAIFFAIGASIIGFSLVGPAGSDASPTRGGSGNHLPGRPIELRPIPNDSNGSNASGGSRLPAQLNGIGELIGQSHRIRIIAAHPEPLYTIMDLNGAVLAKRITASEAALRFPSLPILSLPRDLVPESKDGDPSVRDDLPLLSDTPVDELHY